MYVCFINEQTGNFNSNPLLHNRKKINRKSRSAHNGPQQMQGTPNAAKEIVFAQNRGRFRD